MSARKSIFARLAAGPPGIDPYTTAVSDVYQDLFGEGSFVGKGIYDVDAFEAALQGRVPDNQLLSHDLFESIYARSALASDIEVLDEQPAAYPVAAGRQHRWTRGDWQLLPWLGFRVPAKVGRRKNDLRAIDAWRVLDNLRRSLLAPALVLLSTCTWLSGFQSAWVGSLFLVAVFVVPVFGRMVFAFARSDSQLEWLGGLAGDLRSNAAQAFLSLVFLLDQALLSVDAIARALYRQFVSRRGMLEWTSMRDASNQSENSVLRVPRLLVAAAVALILALSVTLLAPDALLVSAPIIALWAVAPWVSVWINRVEPATVAEPWGPSEVRSFRRIARKTWRFFERFVGDLDHHLPPDNFQEDPRGVVAHRTSPTNIGLYLLSVAAARDLGFIGLDEALLRWGRTLSTVERLEKREGHVLNWYDTTTLTPLEPRYVSTVDSGNLAGYLWTLAEACKDAKEAPYLSESVLLAALDAARLAREVAQGGRVTSEARRVEQLVALLERAEGELRVEPKALLRLLGWVSAEMERWSSPDVETGGPGEAGYWIGAARRTLAEARASIERHLPHVVWFESKKEALLRPSSGAEGDGLGRSFEELVEATWSPRGVVENATALLDVAREFLADRMGAEASTEFELLVQRATDEARQQLAELDSLAARANELVDGMDFTFVYDEERSLFSIGYNVSGARLDNSYYDLLASEARLASLVAIAKGDVPQKHWFRLGRLRAKYASAPGLLSWSGSMFEYLMPLLVTRSYPDTLLDQTCHAVIERQIAHARHFGVPWGISEAAYNVMDLGMNYQYRAFGVPELGLKPGLGEDLVVTPYATALGGLLRARAAAQNFDELAGAGLEGPYGFYEAIDYTPSRLPPGRGSVVVKAFMAHHQGMTLVALSNLLSDFAMQRRFHADPRIKACALLLEERIPPRAGVVQPETPRIAPNLTAALEQESTEHLDFAEVQKDELRGQLLGQGSLATWVTSGGGGFTTWRGLDVQRFREDASLECGGIYLYFRNLDGGHYWSSGYLPTKAEPRHYDVVFSIDKIELARRDGDIETLTEITVSPEHAAEIRRVTLTNHATRSVRLDVTSFTELSLAPRVADVAHPAFQKLFVELEFLEERGALLAHRRKRSEHDPDVWVAQLYVGGEAEELTRFATSRSDFLGRGGSVEAPHGLADDRLWAGARAVPLDPALILRRSFELAPGGQARFSLVTLLAESRPALLELIEQFAAGNSVPRAFELAWADARVHLRHLDITSSKAHRYQRLLSAMLFPQPALRESTQPPLGTRSKDALWSQGISGDLPIVVLRLDDPAFSDLCRDLLLAHEYWRLNGLSSDLVILNEEAPSYLQPTQEAVLSLIRSTPAEGHVDQRGGVFVRRTTLISEEDLQLLLSVARVVLSASRGSLAKQLRALAPRSLRKIRPGLSRRTIASVPPPPALLRWPRPVLAGPARTSDFGLLFENGIGGFAKDSSEYVMSIGPGQRPPQPWSNVMAGPRFGTLVTESGSSFTWFDNSQKNRLTPWFNDPTLDPSGELFFVRDLEAAADWSLTPSPSGGDAFYQVRHGQGASSFEHMRHELVQRLTVAVDPVDTVKIWHLSLKNTSKRRRRLRIYAYAEWVLGSHRETLRVSTITNYRPELRSILARNPFSPLPKSCAFFSSTAEVLSATADRDDFFGRFGSRARPAALRRGGLSGGSGPGFDPCAAFEVEITIEAGSETKLAFALGADDDERAALKLIGRYAELDEAEALLARASAHWQDLLGRVQVRTPDPAFDVLINNWLPYQVLSCRFWGRSAFFQSGGAYGFRDQLQDCLALVHMRPDLTRQHILLAASRQFVEGDVQHWWHQDSGEGVRTHCSDDLLWLPWAALEYSKSTGDFDIWQEQVGFLQERLLEPGRDDLYSIPPPAAESASLYEHCVRALETGATRGPKGLPLLRAGDWNDGMNRMGQAGLGESVWLGWFLAYVLEAFGQRAELRGDAVRADWCRSEWARLSRALDEVAWDGAWYRRATFDDGSPVGSEESAECRIDAIAQSWAVISRAARPDRASQALDASLEHLWNREEKMMLLLTPPFSGAGPDPGYIAAYPPGIRENGGQYSHGVLWTALALLMERRGAEAHELLSDLNPIRHTTKPEDLAKYQVEPYVLAADVYSEAPHVGRGGWTWYTGSASWMYRIGVEWLFGIQRRGEELVIDPCVPPNWSHFELDYRTEAGGQLSIVFENPEGTSYGVLELVLDGRALGGNRVPLPGAGERRELSVRMGAKPSQSSPHPLQEHAELAPAIRRGHR
jgi:cyclic beta-1,2-glucan synthetase